MKKKLVEILNTYIPSGVVSQGHGQDGNSRETLTQIQAHLLEVNYKHQGETERKSEFRSEIANMFNKPALGEIMYSFYQESNRDRFLSLKDAGLKLSRGAIDELFAFSAQYDNLETVQFLSSLCSNINKVPAFVSRMDTALLRSVKSGCSSIAITQFLLEAKADPNTNSPLTRYKISHIDKSPLRTALEAKKYNMVKLLLEHQADPNEQHSGVTLLWRVINGGNAERGNAVKLLLDYKANPNTILEYQRLPVLFNVINDEPVSINIMNLLLEAKADYNVIDDSSNRTPLIMAVRNCSYRAAKVLIEAQADVNLSSSNGDTALMILQRGGSPVSNQRSQLIEMLKDRQSTSSAVLISKEQCEARDKLTKLLEETSFAQALGDSSAHEARPESAAAAAAAVSDTPIELAGLDSLNEFNT